MKNKIWLLRFMTFLSSFLLFQIEFIIGKIFLANFGGGVMVWGACLVFFQAVLLLGYLYAHFMAEKVSIAKYVAPHCILLMLPLLFFPGRDLAVTFKTFGFPMVVDVSIHLALSIGLVFFVLSTMSIIFQSWLAAADLPQSENPYALFAVSNVGSLLALATYPFIFEMFFDLRQQQMIWRALYAGMIFLYVIGLKLIPVRRKEKKLQKNMGHQTVPNGLILKWFFYGAAGVSVFLAVTNVVTAEIAPMPLLWMMPLMIYLLSYILNFKRRPWSPKFIETTIHFTVGIGVVLYFITVRQIVPVFTGMILMLLFVFVICMFCQRRLYALRPEVEKLTFFYFIVALGGFFGGMLTTWIIPLIYVSHAEYFLGLVLLFIAWAGEGEKRTTHWGMFIGIILIMAAFYWGPVFLKQYKVWGLAGFGLFIVLSFYALRKDRKAILVVLVLTFILLGMLEPRWFRQQYLYGKRNYYGMSRVAEQHGMRMLIQGTTIHGAQFLDPKSSFIPLTYYHPTSPPAELLINEQQYRHIGVVGLGAGSLAMYGQPYQQIDFYELDKDVLMIAEKYFTFLAMSPANIHYIINDARVGLKKNDNRRYDILIVDAFNGDAVPVHLLTRECLDLYHQRLKQGGVILFHLANRYINLPDAFMGTVVSTDAHIAYKKDAESSSDWVAVTHDWKVYERLIREYGWEVVFKSQYKNFRPWTDEYSNIIPYFFRQEVLFNFFKRWNIG